MEDVKNKLEIVKDKAEGEIKEKVGKATGNQELELEGKIKKKVTEAKEKAAEKKEHLFEKINDKIDKSDK